MAKKKKEKFLKPNDIDKSKGKTYKQLKKGLKKSTLGRVGTCIRCNKNFDVKKNDKELAEHWWRRSICSLRCYKKWYKKLKEEWKLEHGDYEKPFPWEFYKIKVERKLKRRKKRRRKK